MKQQKGGIDRNQDLFPQVTPNYFCIENVLYQTISTKKKM